MLIKLKNIPKCKFNLQNALVFSVNNIIGFPDETRELAFDTIELNQDESKIISPIFTYNDEFTPAPDQIEDFESSGTIIDSTLNSEIDFTIISSDVVVENSIIMSDCKIDGGLNIKDSIISANCHLHGNNKDKTKKIFLLGEGTKITL